MPLTPDFQHDAALLVPHQEDALDQDDHAAIIARQTYSHDSAECMFSGIGHHLSDPILFPSFPRPPALQDIEPWKSLIDDIDLPRWAEEFSRFNLSDVPGNGDELRFPDVNPLLNSKSDPWDEDLRHNKLIQWSSRKTQSYVPIIYQNCPSFVDSAYVSAGSRSRPSQKSTNPAPTRTYDMNSSQPLQFAAYDMNPSQPLQIPTYDMNLSQTFRAFAYNMSQPATPPSETEYPFAVLGNQISDRRQDSQYSRLRTRKRRNLSPEGRVHAGLVRRAGACKNCHTAHRRVSSLWEV